MEALFPLLVVLIIIAAILRQDAVLVVFYLLAGVYLVGVWWSKNAFRHIYVRRSFTGRAFFNQPVQVTVELSNRGWLPVVWLKLHESLPVNLAPPSFVESVVTINPRGKARVQYSLTARRRGYYQLGPVFLDSGDMLGLSKESSGQSVMDNLIVYPRIVPLEKLGLPSQSPFGTLAERRPIFEDPSRVRGKRDYVAGDSLRRIDWKASASTGRLQVKNYEPSIALTACVVLNLNPEDYVASYQIASSEVAVTTAASIASWVVEHRQAVGFATNGLDPLGGNTVPQPLPPRGGNGALMQVLDVLARIQPGATVPCEELLRRAAPALAWGTTLVLVTSLFNEHLLEELFQLQRRGLNVVIVAVGHLPHQQEVHQRARQFRIPVYKIEMESDLEVWQTP